MNKKTINTFVALNAHLKSLKYEINPTRYADLKDAYEIACKLFDDMSISIEDDPLNLGAKFLCIKGFDIIVRGQDDIELFSNMIAKADNFEILALESEHIVCNIMFQDCLQKLK